jgi:hypothetical protein
MWSTVQVRDSAALAEIKGILPEKAAVIMNPFKSLAAITQRLNL